eukprot:1142563-Pelagomonas_calceolata.AAC.4
MEGLQGPMFVFLKGRAVSEKARFQGEAQSFKEKHNLRTCRDCVGPRRHSMCLLAYSMTRPRKVEARSKHVSPYCAIVPTNQFKVSLCTAAVIKGKSSFVNHDLWIWDRSIFEPAKDEAFSKKDQLGWKHETPALCFDFAIPSWVFPPGWETLLKVGSAVDSKQWN